MNDPLIIYSQYAIGKYFKLSTLKMDNTAGWYCWKALNGVFTPEDFINRLLHVKKSQYR